MEAAQYTGRFHTAQLSDVNFDIRWLQSTAKTDRTKFQVSLNKVMRSIWIPDLTKRYECLIKPESKSSYEEWIIEKKINLKVFRVYILVMRLLLLGKTRKELVCQTDRF